MKLNEDALPEPIPVSPKPTTWLDSRLCLILSTLQPPAIMIRSNTEFQISQNGLMDVRYVGPWIGYRDAKALSGRMVDFRKLYLSVQ